MSPEEHAKVSELFSRAVRVSPGKREDFVRRESGEDSEIFRQVMSLLRYHRDETILENDESRVESIQVTPRDATSPLLVDRRVGEENGELRRQRLTLIASLLTVISAASVVRLLLIGYDQWNIGIRILATVVSAMLAVWLHRQRKIRETGLRIAELAVIGNIGVLAIVVYVLGIRTFAKIPEATTVVALNHWLYIAWTMIIFVYGVFMPNSWKRAARILIPMSIIPLVVDGLLRMYDPTVKAILGTNELGSQFLSPIAAAGVAICAAQSIYGARVAAMRARQLSQYQTSRLIGRGAMGEVYEAEHLLMKRACAIKLIHPDRSEDNKAVRRFEREVRATARLTHPHTIEVYDYGETTDGIFYYVMELLPGMNLRELVKTAGPLPPERAIHFLIEVCEALTEAHGAGLIHRDIKPPNIFASERGGIYDFTKLLDFGVARNVQLDLNASLSSLMVAGTPSFMSPEQAAMPQEVDVRSDLYSVGAVGYYLLSGRAPFAGRSPMEVMLAVVHEPVKRLSQLRPDVPDDLEQVVMRCLAKEPRNRFATAKDLLEALHACQCAGKWKREHALEWWRQHRAVPPKVMHADQETMVNDDTDA